MSFLIFFFGVNQSTDCLNSSFLCSPKSYFCNFSLWATVNKADFAFPYCIFLLTYFNFIRSRISSSQDKCLFNFIRYWHISVSFYISTSSVQEILWLYIFVVLGILRFYYVTLSSGKYIIAWIYTYWIIYLFVCLFAILYLL